MNAPLSIDISRRGLLAGGGAVVVSFSLFGMSEVTAQTVPQPARPFPTTPCWIPGSAWTHKAW